MNNKANENEIKIKNIKMNYFIGKTTLCLPLYWFLSVITIKFAIYQTRYRNR